MNQNLAPVPPCGIVNDQGLSVVLPGVVKAVLVAHPIPARRFIDVIEMPRAANSSRPNPRPVA